MSATAKPLLEDNKFFCFQCGKCTSVCPVASLDERFNPRLIVLTGLFGDRAALAAQDSPIWLCTTCYNCHEHCPQEVSPIDMIYNIKNLAARMGTAPETCEQVAQAIAKTGFATQVGGSVNSRRARLGLAEIAQADADELARLLES
jgi:heterodisulfide reductase subunit C